MMNVPATSSTAPPPAPAEQAGNIAALAMQNSIQQQQIAEMQATIAAQQRVL